MTMIKYLRTLLPLLIFFCSGYWFGAQDAGTQTARKISEGSANTWASALLIYKDSQSGKHADYYQEGYQAVVEKMLWSDIEFYVELNEKLKEQPRGAIPYNPIYKFVHKYEISNVLTIPNVVDRYFKVNPPQNEKRKDLLGKYREFYQNHRI